MLISLQQWYSNPMPDEKEKKEEEKKKGYTDIKILADSDKPIVIFMLWPIYG